MEMSIQFPNIGINLGNVGRAVNVLGYEITFYGILIAVGMILGISFVVLDARRHGQNPNMYLGMILTALVTGLIGARLFYAGFSWSLYRGNIQSLLNIRNGGLSLYGGILGGSLGATLFCKVARQPFWQMGDTASIGLLIAQIIGRWGGFFNRESFGEYTDNLLAMRLPLSAVQSSAVSAKMRENLIVLDGVSYIQVHPVFLYESILCLLLLLFLLASQRRKRFQGEIFIRYLALYGLIRCFTEWLRTDQIRFPGTKIPVSLIVSGFLFIFFGINAIVRRTMEKKRAAARRRRREALYAAEEQAEAEMDRQEEEKSREAARQQEQSQQKEEQEPEDDWDGSLPSSRNKPETVLSENSPAEDSMPAETSGQPNPFPERSAEEPASQSETGSSDPSLSESEK